MKTCSRCGLTKPVSEFWRNRYTKDGLQPGCKECCAPANRREQNARRRAERELARRHRDEFQELLVREREAS